MIVHYSILFIGAIEMTIDVCLVPESYIRVGLSLTFKTFPSTVSQAVQLQF